MAKMTAIEVAALKPGAKPYKKTVDTGLQLRVAVDGTKTWVVQYVVHGKQRELRLARPWGPKTDGGHLSLQDARLQAQEVRALARAGIDYQRQQEQQRQDAAVQQEAQRLAALAESERARVDRLSVQDMFDKWLTDGVRRKDGNAELQRSFSKDVLPVIGSISVKALNEDDVRGVLRQLVDRGRNRLAVMTYKNLVQLFRWAQKRQPWRRLLIEQNPVELIDIERIVDPDYDMRNERDRVLSEAEIRELYDILARSRADYEAAPDRRRAARPLAATTEHAIWLMLATMCRVGELTLARWEHVDLDLATWFIPAENTKGSRKYQQDLTVFLSPLAVRHFNALKAKTGHTHWCFPSADGERPIDRKAIAKQIGDRQTMFKLDSHGKARKPLKRRSRQSNSLVLANGRNGAWTPHDLRRTASTLMQKLKIAPDVIDRCQNHRLAGAKVRRHYQLHDYADEMREAWFALGRRLDEILTTDAKVLALVRRA